MRSSTERADFRAAKKCYRGGIRALHTAFFGNVTKPTKGGRPAPMNGHPLTLSGSLGFAILLSKIIQPYTTSARASSESINWHAEQQLMIQNEWPPQPIVVVVAAARHCERHSNRL
jgi:hypothetical protein